VDVVADGVFCLHKIRFFVDASIRFQLNSLSRNGFI
jgi:hypothetical protein